jgi:iron(III) transport system substrate-binding protein
MAFRIRIALVAATFALAAASVAADDLPKATMEQLKAIHTDPSILAGIDDELKVPQGWIDGARKEKKVRVFGSRDPKEFIESSRPFKERYPFVTFDYTRATYGNRALNILVAFQSGRVITDVLTGFGGSVTQFKDSGALESLSDVPNVKKVASDVMRDDDGFWVGHQMTHWCITYNTQRIKAEDLPKTWEDLLTIPVWGQGHLGLGNRPQLWLAQLFGYYGEDWAKNYVDKLFTQLKPQLRTEGINAMISLTAAGELSAALPGSGYRTQRDASRGAPVSFHCPEPVPMSINLMAIMRGTPSPNAAKLFVNWTLSREGQIAQYAADRSAPIHADLQNDEFVPFAQNVKGKKVAVRSPALLEEASEPLYAIWNARWGKSGQ